MPDAYYFGCWHRPGHYYRLPDAQQLGRGLLSADRAARVDLGPHCLRVDGLYVPKQPGVWAHGFTDGTALGVDGWTYLSAQDFTVDTRPGSHSTFLLRGHIAQAAMVATVAMLFPAIAVRVGLALDPEQLVIVCRRCHRKTRPGRLHTCEARDA